MSEHGELICNCMKVYKSTIVDAIKEQNLVILNDVCEATGAGTGCGQCLDKIQKVLDEVNN